jgi:hypothetical protein
MTFEQCIRALVTEALAEGYITAAAMFMRYPHPTAQEWADCLHEAVQVGDDQGRAEHCMTSYELRLESRGFPTVLGFAAREWIEAACGQLPPDYLMRYLNGCRASRFIASDAMEESRSREMEWGRLGVRLAANDA